MGGLTHRQIQHGVGQGDWVAPQPPQPPGEAQNYRVSFPKNLLRLRCPVYGCLGGASNRTNLLVHFAHCQAWYTIVVLDEGNRPYPRCPKCDMFVLHQDLKFRHLATAFCQREEERKRRCLAEDEARAGTELAITAYGTPINLVTSFKYLGRVLSEADENWPAVVNNLWRARQKWVRLTRVSSREGADARTSGQIYLAVVHLVMLYRSDTWVMTPHIGRVWGISHHRVSHRLTGRQTWKGRDGLWVYLPLEDAMAEAGLQEVETYVSCLQNIVAQFISTRPIMDLCLAEERRQESRVANQ